MLIIASRRRSGMSKTRPMYTFTSSRVMVWGGRAVAVAAMVGYEAAAASVGRLLADSISLLGHEAGAASPPLTSYFDAAVPRQAAFEHMALHQFFACSELLSTRRGG